MVTNFKTNVNCILTGKDNWEIWYKAVINAARYEGFWRRHLQPDANGNPPGPPGSQPAASGTTSTEGATTTPPSTTPARSAASAEAIEKWEDDDDRIRAGIVMCIAPSIQTLIVDNVHKTAWDVLQLLKKNFDTKSDLEFVHLIMELNEIEMENGRAGETINRLRPIKQHIDESYSNQCITWAFLIRSCIHLPRYNNLLTGLQSTGTLKQLNFEQLAERFIELDKTMDPKFTKRDPGAAYQVEDDDEEACYTKRQGSHRGRGRGRPSGPPRSSNPHLPPM